MATAAGTTTTRALARFARSVAVWGVLGVSAHGNVHAERPSLASVEELMAINGAREAQESAVGGIEAQVRSP